MSSQPFSATRATLIALLVIVLTILFYFVMNSKKMDAPTSEVSSASAAVSPIATEADIEEIASVSVTSSSTAPLASTSAQKIASIASGSSSVGTSTALISKVRYALLAEPVKDGDFKHMRGCDLIAFSKEVKITPTAAPLEAALKALFARNEPWPASETSAGNFITAHKSLKFDSATIENGEAKIYLSGTAKLDGICDDPRIGLQVSETALQFPSIKSVSVYLNNELLMVPSAKTE